MRKLSFTYILYFLLLCIFSNLFMLKNKILLLLLCVPLFIFINLFAGTKTIKTDTKQLKICYHGGILLSLFLASLAVSIICHIIFAFKTFPNNYWAFIPSALFCILIEAIVFWNGIICVYLTSVQLKLKQRILGIIFGFVPIVNLIMLFSIIKTVFSEVEFEIKKQEINSQRNSQQICKTRYPILFVHGVFFRDSKYFNYWGRIPKELIKNGAVVYYGNHQSAASVKNSAEELNRRIKEIVDTFHCEKVNIIAHSKGGLDCRYAISKLDAAPYVASLTTVNTPHKGCKFADYLLTYIPQKIKNKVADTYNSALRKLGDSNPDFLAAVNDLTASACKDLNCELTTPNGIFCQSIGSVLRKASGGKFPLNFSYHLVKFFDGANDGLVSENSFAWGEKYTLVTPNGKRGISHGDMIDLNRDNIDGFDVREFYVDLVSKLKNMNL